MISYVFLSPATLSEADRGAIEQLLGQLSHRPITVSHEETESILAQARVLAARNEEGRMVGMASLYKMTLFGRTIGHVEQVVVDQNTRGQGIGRSLMEHLIAEARRLGISRMILTSRPERVEANQLYQRLGFSLYETNVYRMDLG
jgi:N-acetylglutamate synthase-like GNAT family acetyltransferase